jgi:RNA 3'-terminal phosphate cyclase (ATP)
VLAGARFQEPYWPKVMLRLLLFTGSNPVTSTKILIKRTKGKKMIVVNGAQGEGGGQIFRSTLTLSMCLGKAVRIENTRAGRSKPGLLRQHLTCLRAAQSICGAQITGDELGSTVVTFIPGEVKAGNYRFSVGSAGSTTLVFQTVLLPLLKAEGESELTLEGGTHNGLAPSYEFIEKCFVPLMASLGYRIETELDRYGFYPAGGGAWRARIFPSKDINKLKLLEAGRLEQKSALAISANIPEHVCDRELKRIGKKEGWFESKLEKRLVRSAGPGNILSLTLEMENVKEVFEALGDHGVKAERVADKAYSQMKRYLEAGVPVGEYLADQLLLPLVLGKGGCFRTLKPSQHLLTNIEVVGLLSDAEIKLSELGTDKWDVRVSTY